MVTRAEEIFTPIRPGVLATEVSAQIRARILDGSIAPGQPIKDSVLAETLGLSRSPVREALRILEQRGLLRKSPNRPYEVVAFSDTDAEELAMLRTAYESMAVHWLVEHDTDISALRDPLRDMTPVDDSEGEKARVVDADARFHTTLIELTGLPRLIASYTAICDQIALMLSGGRLKRYELVRTQRERHDHLYRLLVAAQDSRDATDVVAALASHIRGGMGLPLDGVDEPAP